MTEGYRETRREAPEAARVRRPRLTAAVLVCLAVSKLAYLVGEAAAAGAVARVAALMAIVLVAPRFGLREWLLFAAALALAAGLVARDGDWTAAREALDRGAFFAAFILLMMLLREAAATSSAVLAMGHFLTRQQPGRRFLATFIGANLTAALLNFGAISLLAPLIQRGVRAEPAETEDDARRARIREQRQLSALVRGFACVFTWAPTTLTQAIILSSIPGVAVSQMLVLGLTLSALFLVVGWGEDRLRWGKPRRRAPGVPVVPFPWRAAGDLAVVAGCLGAGAWAARATLGIATAEALMLLAPMILAGWVFAQNAGLGPGEGLRALRRRLGEIAAGPIPLMGREAFLLGVAGFIGTAAARLAPIDWIAAHLALEHVPAWMFLTALPVIIVAAGNVAISPIMTVVFLAAVVTALPVMPAAPELVALGLAVGWGLSMTTAPNATGPILLAGITGLPTTVLTWRWNGVYSLGALTVVAGLFYALA